VQVDDETLQCMVCSVKLLQQKKKQTSAHALQHRCCCCCCSSNGSLGTRSGFDQLMLAANQKGQLNNVSRCLIACLDKLVAHIDRGS
jgi:hypothetical protein